MAANKRKAKNSSQGHRKRVRDSNTPVDQRASVVEVEDVGDSGSDEVEEVQQPTETPKEELSECDVMSKFN